MNKSLRRLVIILITIISVLIAIPLLWVTSVYIDLYPDSDQIVLIKPSIFRVDDIIPAFEDPVPTPARARYCIAVAAGIEARTKASLIELNNYYKEYSNRFFAKTGTLSGVVALSGYMYTNKNRLLIFSVLVNNHQSSVTAVRRAVEKFLTEIMEKE